MSVTTIFQGHWRSPHKPRSKGRPTGTNMTNSTDSLGNGGAQDPSPYNEPSDESSGLSPREQETVAGLRRLDPQLAGLYELGLKLASEIERPGYAHALAYVGREPESCNAAPIWSVCA